MKDKSVLTIYFNTDVNEYVETIRETIEDTLGVEILQIDEVWE